MLITTHVRPDGDALGSTAALVLALRKVGIPSEVLLLSHLPSKYAFIYAENDIQFYDAEKGWPATLSLEKYDALLVADTGTWSQLPGLKDRIDQITGPKLVLDHHLTQESWADAKLVDTRAPAAAEIVGQLLEQWDITLDAPIAAAIYLGLVSDTGWFQYSSTRPADDAPGGPPDGSGRRYRFVVSTALSKRKTTAAAAPNPLAPINGVAGR